MLNTFNISYLTFYGIFYTLNFVTSTIFYSWGLLMLRQTKIRLSIIFKCHFYMFYTIWNRNNRGRCFKSAATTFKICSQLPCCFLKTIVSFSATMFSFVPWVINLNVILTETRSICNLPLLGVTTLILGVYP